MRNLILPLLATSLACSAALAQPVAKDADKDKDKEKEAEVDLAKKAHPDELKNEEHQSEGSVSVGGKQVEYTAVAGLLVVPPADTVEDEPDQKEKPVHPQAAMSYVAYFKKMPGDKSADARVKLAARPIMFIYNGGPGSSTIWLHMGAFGPRRVVTPDNSHAPAAPYKLVNNDSSLLDVADLVFIDAPGTGFGKVIGKDKEKAFYGIDPDAKAFSDFIVSFIGKYGRWNSPKFIFGESYGTPRSALVAHELQSRGIDLNGVILLSQILVFDASADAPQLNPGVELPYQLILPTYAATAWYHKKLPPDAPQSLDALLAEVERFAMTDYAAALEEGNALDPAKRKAVAAQLHRYTGLPVDYLEKANLRVNVGEFSKTLRLEEGMTTGRLDSRFAGPTIDLLSQEADYDPQSAAISAAYIAVFNDYARKDLRWGGEKSFKAFAPLWKSWNFMHQPEGQPIPIPQAANVLPDLASTMKQNPGLHVMCNAGYFDLATPFYEGVYEMKHLQIPDSLRNNIEFKFYDSGHMVYAHEESLKALHDNVAQFITAYSGTK
jgi:carboxypeptidase C (cathepsin A)